MSFKTILSEITLQNQNWLILGVYESLIQKDEIILQNLNTVQFMKILY